MDLPVIALDVGGTSIKSGLVFGLTEVRAVRSDHVDADGPAPAIVGALATTIDRLASSLPADVEAPVAIAFPGPFDYRNGVPQLTHKFAAIAGRPLEPTLRAECRHRIGPISFVNDAAAAGAGAVGQLGDAAPRTVLVITLGTGLGSSLLEEGRLIERRSGIVIGELWAEQHRGEQADQLFSATGLARVLDVPARDLAAVCYLDDERTTHRIEEWGAELGRFLRPIVEAVDAGLVVVGGGAAGAFSRFRSSLGAELRVPATPVPDATDAPLIGAAARVGTNLPPGS